MISESHDPPHLWAPRLRHAKFRASRSRQIDSSEQRNQLRSRMCAHSVIVNRLDYDLPLIQDDSRSRNHFQIAFSLPSAPATRRGSAHRTRFAFLALRISISHSQRTAIHPMHRILSHANYVRLSRFAFLVIFSRRLAVAMSSYLFRLLLADDLVAPCAALSPKCNKVTTKRASARVKKSNESHHVDASAKTIKR